MPIAFQMKCCGGMFYKNNSCLLLQQLLTYRCTLQARTCLCRKAVRCTVAAEAEAARVAAPRSPARCPPPRSPSPPPRTTPPTSSTRRPTSRTRYPTPTVTRNNAPHTRYICTEIPARSQWKRTWKHLQAQILSTSSKSDNSLTSPVCRNIRHLPCKRWCSSEFYICYVIENPSFQPRLGQKPPTDWTTFTYNTKP